MNLMTQETLNVKNVDARILLMTLKKRLSSKAFGVIKFLFWGG